jgi:hypothetical protein
MIFLSGFIGLAGQALQCFFACLWDTGIGEKPVKPLPNSVRGLLRDWRFPCVVEAYDISAYCGSFSIQALQARRFAILDRSPKRFGRLSAPHPAQAKNVSHALDTIRNIREYMSTMRHEIVGDLF